MAKYALKLKQASAVLQIQPKDLQNLVQFGVVKPRRSDGTYLFDANALVVAKIAFCLKDHLGTRMSVLSRLMDAFLLAEQKLKSVNPRYVVFQCRLSTKDDPVKLSVPFRAIEKQIEERISRSAIYRDMPRGRKRPGWKKEFLQSLADAARDMGEVPEEDILRIVRDYRNERRTPEITVVAES